MTPELVSTLIERETRFTLDTPFSTWLVGGILVATTALVVAGIWSMQHMRLDAIPDLSDPQVIVFSRWDRSPDLVEDQITYPIVTALLGAPGVTAVRGMSDFGHSFVHVIFKEGTDLYWARSRVQEYLAPALAGLPEDARTELGPDATGLGWIFQYALVDESGRQSLAELRALQDFYLRYHLRSVPGVAEVAAVGALPRREAAHLVEPHRAHPLLLDRGIDRVARAAHGLPGGQVELEEPVVAEGPAVAAGLLDGPRVAARLAEHDVVEHRPQVLGHVGGNAGDVRRAPALAVPAHEVDVEAEAKPAAAGQATGNSTRKP